MVVRMRVDAYQERLEKQHRDFRWVAWHIDALRRSRRLISFREMMGEKPEAQDVDDMLDAIDRWFTQHNSRLSAEDRRADVVEA